MTVNGWIQIAIYCLAIIVCVKPLGLYMARFFEGEIKFLAPVERVLYRICGVKGEEQHWTTYTIAMLAFSIAGFLSLYLIQRFQAALPFNPQALATVTPDLSFNTSISFITNTNWQSYSGETTLSYLVQMLGLTVHNFLSAATGIVLAIALVRGFARRSGKTLGNFWVDLTRCTLYLLLPMSILFGLFLVWQGVPQNLGAYTHVVGLDGFKQLIAQGPVASQEAIKMLGTNGGGFFNANSAHPFENPTGLTDFAELWAILVISASLTYTFGRMVKDTRQGWAIFAVMAVLFLGGLGITYWAEAQGNAAVAAAHVAQPTGNMEGKEVRFGVVNSVLWSTATTDASNGSVNAMHDSFTPLGGMIPIINIELGEIIFGGVGSGLYGILIWAVVAMFVAGLMVGRTPEYLGKKIEAKEVKMAMLAILILALDILGFTALGAVTKAGLAGPLNTGPHGFSEILYAFTSATGNNGSAFAGLTANTVFYNTTLGFAMLIGRFLFIVPMMAVAGSLVTKKIVPTSAGTFPTHGGLFVGLLVGVILIVGGLTFFPALSLGPIVEHLAMQAGTFF
ncbi:MAG TPA: potassium-transporting ATPase subunit KdpA [Rhizomicrobium sp.]|jgi:K+-transporting ATPase ATPase A chain|nr:potassium-transporting ATPase subunit KdpA [Rhizomicrobium sp.]